jgi:hypothetical protein
MRWSGLRRIEGVALISRGRRSRALLPGEAISRTQFTEQAKARFQIGLCSKRALAILRHLESLFVVITSAVNLRAEPATESADRCVAKRRSARRAA